MFVKIVVSRKIQTVSCATIGDQKSTIDSLCVCVCVRHFPQMRECVRVRKCKYACVRERGGSRSLGIIQETDPHLTKKGRVETRGDNVGKWKLCSMTEQKWKLGHVFAEMSRNGLRR